MKKLKLVTTCIFWLLSSFVFSQWEKQSPYPTSERLNDVFFFNQSIGWICGENGTILFTNDSGEKWVHQEGFTTQTLQCMSFINDQNGWIVGNMGTILHTTDGGENWMDQSFTDTIHLQSVFFIEQTGWAAGSSSGNGIILYTSDAGVSWQIQYLEPDNGFNDLCFTSLTSGWVVGDHGIFHTTDGGVNWNEQYNSASFHFLAVTFLDSLNGWAAGGYGELLLHTVDGGINWIPETINLQLNNTITDIFFTDTMHGWLSSNGGEPGNTSLMVHTSDGGENWEYCPNVNLVFSDQIYGIHFLDEQTGWEVGVNGNIAFTENGESWEKQSSMINDKEITDISFIDDQNGFALANIGYILDESIFMTTNNSGKDWEFLYQFMDWTHYLFVIDAYNFWVTGEHFIYNTSNGGISWDISDPFDGNVSTDIFFTDVLNGWATDWDIFDDKTRIYHTSDGGGSWQEQYPGEGELLKTIYFYDQNTGWVAGRSGDSGVIVKTTDGGTTWLNQLYVNNQSFSKISFSSSDNGLAIGYHGSVFQTTDGGENWNQINDGFDIDISDVFVVSTDHIWIVGRQGQYPQPVIKGLIYHSTDGGQTWVEQESGTSEELLSIWFNDVENGWVAGENGTILHTDNGGIYTEVPEVKIPHSNLQLLNFPNPLNSNTTIEFTIPSKGLVNLSIIDFTGKEIQTLISQQLSKGDHQFVWNTYGLPPGIYFLRLETNGISETRKLIKIQ